MLYIKKTYTYAQRGSRSTHSLEYLAALHKMQVVIYIYDFSFFYHYYAR